MFVPSGDDRCVVLTDLFLFAVIQYGFVTLFVAAFPLAPFFALLNNIVEVRLDATKMVTQWKRPMAERAQDIGTWFFILKVLSKMAVLVNVSIPVLFPLDLWLITQTLFPNFQNCSMRFECF